ncbi:polysaccharide deacetylase family protein [Thalassotalea mangrovi]|uniref:Polysaccharide deacetylase n=1 Tax=Thalassotalea mangrovi TaxID=2572245 RepID=A0A4U1B6M0_9GAMM|nr:polysaccharide deacetylase family protein [Thalassotalea mangrovi]TKB45561.1 polysaccharide deacetylase [Thalassotalea mangrovi]
MKLLKSFIHRLIVTLLILLPVASAQAAVILVYHHVSEDTPVSTSLSPAQFTRHLTYLRDHGFTVIPLNELVDNLKAGKKIADKTVVITFDDGYTDIYEQAHPILKEFDYPYTLFINPGKVAKQKSGYLTWAQLKVMSDDGVLIANHGLHHDSLIKTPAGMTNQSWVAEKIKQLQESEQILKEKLGQSWKYFALPYGEYHADIQQQLQALDYVVFTQQSGAVGLNTDLTAVPRFPASQPYDKLKPLATKLNSLPFNIASDSQRSDTIVAASTDPEELDKIIHLSVDDFSPSQLSCFVSGQGRVDVKWAEDKSAVNLLIKQPLTTGRVRANCTAPSINNPGRYYWYSRPWFVKKADGSWYSD